jgi:hypothetical protein
MDQKALFDDTPFICGIAHNSSEELPYFLRICPTVSLQI